MMLRYRPRRRPRFRSLNAFSKWLSHFSLFNSHFFLRRVNYAELAFPVLLVHSDDDRNVPFQQTSDLVEKLRAQKVALEGLLIPDEIHDLLRWSDWIRAYCAPPPNSSTAVWPPRASGDKPAAVVSSDRRRNRINGVFPTYGPNCLRQENSFRFESAVRSGRLR
jgi:Prolyl oligopeptidase family